MDAKNSIEKEILDLIRERGEDPHAALRNVAHLMRDNGDRYFFGSSMQLSPKMKYTMIGMAICWVLLYNAIYAMADWEWNFIYVVVLASQIILTMTFWILLRETGKPFEIIEEEDRLTKTRPAKP